MGHGIVLNCIVPYYGSGKKLRHTIGYTGSGSLRGDVRVGALGWEVGGVERGGDMLLDSIESN